MEEKCLTRRARVLVVAGTAGISAIVAVVPATAGILGGPRDTSASVSTNQPLPSQQISDGSAACYNADNPFEQLCAFQQHFDGMTTQTASIDAGPYEISPPVAGAAGPPQAFTYSASDDQPDDQPWVTTPRVRVDGAGVHLPGGDVRSYRDTACPQGPGCQTTDPIATPPVRTQTVGVSITNVDVDVPSGGSTTVSEPTPVANVETSVPVGTSTTDLGVTGTVTATQTVTDPSGDTASLDLSDPTSETSDSSTVATRTPTSSL